MDLVFLYSRFSISREFNCLKSTVGRQKVGRLKIDGPAESCHFHQTAKNMFWKKPNWKTLDLELSDLSKDSVCLRKLGLSTRSCGAKGNKQGKAESSTTTTTCTKKLQAEKL